jgi:transposase-like protein
MEAKRKHMIYKEEFRRQAVEMVIHSGKTQAQVARELGRAGLQRIQPQSVERRI